MTTFARAEEFIISGNGDGSDSQITAEVTTTTTVEQTNNANVANSVDVNAATGSNEANGNLGDTSITTGNINEDVTIENTLNNSSVETPCCPDKTSLSISENGADSENNININSQDSNTININQTANITNSITGSGNTGDNQANNNGGNVTIETGSIFANSKITNEPVNFYNIRGGVGGSNGIFANNIFSTTNNVNWNLNTGRNTANGNLGDVSIKTGDIFLNVLIENIANLGRVTVDCCGSTDDPDDPGDPDDPSDPGNPGNPPSSVGSSSGSSSSSSSSSVGPQILGLSDTSGPAARALIFLAGLVMMAAGLSIASKELLYDKAKTH